MAPEFQLIFAGPHFLTLMLVLRDSQLVASFPAQASVSNVSSGSNHGITCSTQSYWYHNDIIPEALNIEDCKAAFDRFAKYEVNDSKDPGKGLTRRHFTDIETPNSIGTPHTWAAHNCQFFVIIRE